MSANYDFDDNCMAFTPYAFARLSAWVAAISQPPTPIACRNAQVLDHVLDEDYEDIMAALPWIVEEGLRTEDQSPGRASCSTGVAAQPSQSATCPDPNSGSTSRYTSPLFSDERRNCATVAPSASSATSDDDGGGVSISHSSYHGYHSRSDYILASALWEFQHVEVLEGIKPGNRFLADLNCGSESLGPGDIRDCARDGRAERFGAVGDQLPTRYTIEELRSLGERNPSSGCCEQCHC